MEQCNDMFLIAGIRPAMLKVIEPTFGSMTYCDIEDSPVAEDAEAGRLLALASCVYSQWFILMKSIMTRERVIARARYEEETGKRVWGDLPYSKVPCERQPLTGTDIATSSAYESVIRATFGDKAADFARERFLRAISTGDKRSFKIRFLFYKSSDGLKGTGLFEPFRKRLEDVVTEAEAAAGCTPDPSPRRMSLAEQERKRRKEMEPKQLTLFDYAEIVADQEANRKDEHGDKGKVANPDEGTGVCSDPCSDPCSDLGDGDSGVPHDGSDIGAGSSSGVCRGVRAADSADGRVSADVNVSQNVEASLPKRSRINRKQKAACGEVNGTGRGEVAEHVIRKTKVYACCSELVKDIESRAVTPYQTMDEVVADIKRGLITPSEAVIFLAELSKRNKRTTNFVWGETKMPVELDTEGRVQDDDSPTDSELDDIEEEDGDLEDEEDRDVGLPSERGIFNERDREDNDGW